MGRTQLTAVTTAKPSRIGTAYSVEYAKVQIKKKPKVRVAPGKPQSQANHLGGKAGRNRVHAAMHRMCG